MSLVTEVAGRSVFVVRKRDGQLRAFYNACRHRGTQLLTPDESRVKRFIRCPYHSWAYDLDGTCVGTPLFTGSDIPHDQQAVFDMEDVKEFDRADYGLLPVAVDSWGPLVFVNLDRDAAPLSETSATCPRVPPAIASRSGRSPASRSTRSRPTTSSWPRTSWSTTTCPGSTQGWFRSPRSTPTIAGRVPECTPGFCTTPIAQDTEEGGWGSGLAPIGGLDASDAVSARFIWLFPNVAVNILPNHVFIILARAASPRQTHETTYLLTHPESTADGDGEQAVEQLAGFWDCVNREDIDDRRAGAGGPRLDPLPRRPPLLPVRGAAASLPEHGHRPHGRRTANPPGRRRRGRADVQPEPGAPSGASSR